jgi:hypothetical protein
MVAKQEAPMCKNGLVWFMMFNATFNNISVISWWSVLLVEETGVPGENHDLSQVTDKLDHIVLLKMGGFVFCTSDFDQPEHGL